MNKRQWLHGSIIEDSRRRTPIYEPDSSKLGWPTIYHRNVKSRNAKLGIEHKCCAEKWHCVASRPEGCPSPCCAVVTRLALVVDNHSEVSSGWQNTDCVPRKMQISPNRII